MKKIVISFAVILSSIAVVAGCAQSVATKSAAARPSKPAAALTVTPDNNATDVAMNTVPSVQVANATLESVKVTDEKGAELIGLMQDNVWQASARLRPGATYSVVVKAKATSGEDVVKTTTFQTHKPAVIATYQIPYNGQTVGVGMPIGIRFDSPVTSPQFRKAIEEAVTVTTEPKTEGAFGWADERQLQWRPKEYWASGTKVRISGLLTGLQTGEDKYAATDLDGGFTIGESMISNVDLVTHQMTVRRNGAVVKTIPISGGKPTPTYETRSGIKVIIEKQKVVTMDSATVGIKEGDPEYYKKDIENDLRVTWTGEYLHSADWSVASQGRENVSHGCTNLSPENSLWMFDNSKPGDVVIYSGSNRPFLPSEGIGVWQYSWDKWRQRSAVRNGPEQ